MDLTKVSLITERLLLQPVALLYTPEVFNEFTDDVTTYMLPKPEETLEEQQEKDKELIQKLQNGQWLSLDILNKATKEFLGRCFLVELQTATPEFGIWLKKSAHGNKYGQEALQAVKHWADQNIIYDYIKYPVDKKNISSKKIAEALGGVIKDEYKQTNMAGRILDEVEYRIYKQI